VPGLILKPSKQLKSHLLFDGEVFDFLELWLSLGAFDEQSIEGVHPEFNHLYRRFGNSRGAFQKDKIMREFLFARSPWIVETIDTMLKATSRKMTHLDETLVEATANGENAVVDGVATEEAEEEEEEAEDEEEEEDNTPESAELTALERQINANDALHPKPCLDTRVHACETCGIRLLQFTMKIHRHESHSVIGVDADGVDETARK
jgi:hypothetical protein